MELQAVKENELEVVYRSMQRNFCDDEIRTAEGFKKEFKTENYHLVHLVKDGVKVGYMGIWQLSGFAFIEHFVVHEQFRSKGCGSEALGKCKELYGSLVLEAEPPEDGDKIRRINFYKRNGFYVNEDIAYLQPPYKEGGGSVKLYLLSYPQAITNAEAAIAEIYKQVYNKIL